MPLEECMIVSARLMKRPDLTAAVVQFMQQVGADVGAQPENPYALLC